MFLTGGVVFLTLVINGSTTKRLLSFLGMDRLSESKVSAKPSFRPFRPVRSIHSVSDLGDGEAERGS